MSLWGRRTSRMAPAAKCTGGKNALRAFFLFSESIPHSHHPSRASRSQGRTGPSFPPEPTTDDRVEGGRVPGFEGEGVKGGWKASKGRTARGGPVGISPDVVFLGFDI